jgi:hypothetical protein
MSESIDIVAYMRQVVYETIKILFPVSVDPDEIIIPHVWRDRDYLNEYEGKVPIWRGWSVNLKRLDPEFRTLYVDIGENVLPVPQRIETFGEDFAEAIEDKSQFIVIFIVDCPFRAKELLNKEGFVARRINDNIVHACIVASPEEFLTQPTLVWAAMGVKLVNMQKELSKSG